MPPRANPVRSFRYLHRLGHRQHRRARGVRSRTARCRSNATETTPARVSLAEKPSSYPHPILTPRQPRCRDPSYTTFTPCQPILCTGECGEWCGVLMWGAGVAAGRHRASRPAALGRRRCARCARGAWPAIGARFVIFSRSGLLCALCMRASCSKKNFLYVGMRVVCVARRPFWSFGPPTLV